MLSLINTTVFTRFFFFFLFPFLLDISARPTNLARSTLPAGWSLYIGSGNDGGGCYTDSATRIFPTSVLNDNAMTISSCLDACSIKGFTFAAVEYGHECYVMPFTSNRLSPMTDKGE